MNVDVCRECTVTLREDGTISISAAPGIDPMEETLKQIRKTEEWLDLLEQVRHALTLEGYEKQKGESDG